MHRITETNNDETLHRSLHGRDTRRESGMKRAAPRSLLLPLAVLVSGLAATFFTGTYAKFHVTAPVLLSGLPISILLAWVAVAIHGRLQRRYTHDALVANVHLAFKHYPAAVYYLDKKRRFVNANDKAAAEFGIPRDALIGMASEELLAPDDRDAAHAQWLKASVEGQAASYDTVIESRDGRRSDIHVVLVPMLSGGVVAGVLGIAQNITERKRQEVELRSSQHMLQSIVDHLPQLVFWKDTDRRYLGCNRPFADYLGLQVGDLIGRNDQELCLANGHLDSRNLDRYRDEDQKVIREARPGEDIEVLEQHPSGADVWTRIQKVPLFEQDGSVKGVLGVAEDITPRKQLELRLSQMAHYDSLTGLPNRAYLLAQLHNAIRRNSVAGGMLSVLYFDIDRFKSVNDKWGHDTGDLVIREFATRVMQIVRESDVVGRIGGDEFVMVSEGPKSRRDLLGVAERLAQNIRRPFLPREGIILDLSTSIGVSFLEDGVDAEELVRRADQAMFAAKRSGRDRIEVYDSGARDKGAAEMEMEVASAEVERSRTIH